MNPLTTFCWGFFGSFAVEVISIYQSYQNDQELPRRYKLVGFWVVRVTVAIIAEGLPLAMTYIVLFLLLMWGLQLH